MIPRINKQEVARLIGLNMKVIPRVKALGSVGMAKRADDPHTSSRLGVPTCLLGRLCRALARGSTTESAWLAADHGRG
jgi:hypothetical protein